MTAAATTPSDSSTAPAAAWPPPSPSAPSGALIASSPWSSPPPGPQAPPEARSAYPFVRGARILELIFGAFALLAGLMLAIISGVMYNTVHCFTSGHGSTDCTTYGGWFIFGVILLVLGTIGLIAWLLSNPLETAIGQGQNELARSKMLGWTILGFLCFIVPGILFVMAHGKLARLRQWSPGGYPVSAPPSTPPSGSAMPPTTPSPSPTSPWMETPAQAQSTAATPPYTAPPMPTPQAQPAYVPPVSTPPAQVAPVASPAASSLPASSPPVQDTPPAAQSSSPSWGTPPSTAAAAAAPSAPPSSPLCAKCGRPTTYIVQYGRYYCYTDQLYV